MQSATAFTIFNGVKREYLGRFAGGALYATYDAARKTLVIEA